MARRPFLASALGAFTVARGATERYAMGVRFAAQSGAPAGLA
jgi:hypothetical protein